MAINTGVNVSKLIAYAVLAPQVGVDVTKLIAYAVLASGNVSPPLWPSFTFGDGVVNVAYSQSWDMPTSAETVTYSVLSGSLPPDLSLSALSGNQAKIAGTPTTVGVYSFTLRAVNTYGTADQAFSITINAAAASGGSYAFIG
jgi:hypothetical protein